MNLIINETIINKYYIITLKYNFFKNKIIYFMNEK